MNPNKHPVLRYVAAPALAVGLWLGATGCGEAAPPPAVAASAPGNPSPEPAEVQRPIESPSEEQGLDDPSKQLIASQIISTFENSTTEIQYGYAEDIGDGRGITAGRAGFTSGTHDLLQVVQRYTELNPDNPLAKYLPALEKVDGTESTKGLGGFVKAWESASEDDPALNQAQDDIYDKLYFNPAMERAKAAGVETALGQLIILDTIIQHGEGDDPDGLPAIMDEVIGQLGSAKGHEKKWLQKFLKVRSYHLTHAADPETRQAWKESVSRVDDALTSILESGNMNLDTPLEWEVYGDTFQIS